jgi:beta-1,2-mannobiose phosphorylase / 1,2-beta-oligomannan phosphorylase
MLKYEKRYVMGPQADCPWASKMVLNPAIVKDPENGYMLHMLFRTTGPCPEKKLTGKPLPYPIFLGYAVSHDAGKSWKADFSQPALAPDLKYTEGELLLKNISGQDCINYANGCIEDPRLFYFEDELYLSAACRAFPPGPYWEYDDPAQCMPEWAVNNEHSLGVAVSKNSTVSLLYKVNLDALKTKNYAEAFALVGPLHNPNISDDRDVFLFPHKLKLRGREKVVCIHRPKHPWNYPEGKDLKRPSIFLAAADSIADLTGEKVERHVLAVPEFEWEQNRIGASWAPLEISPGEWLLPYHGKQDDKVGYTQSFMILKENTDGFPKITHRPSERLIYADEPWELEGDFTIPCLFTCSGVVLDDGNLLMGYGAADQKIGIAKIPFDYLINTLKQ